MKINLIIFHAFSVPSGVFDPIWHTFGDGDAVYRSAFTFRGIVHLNVATFCYRQFLRISIIFTHAGNRSGHPAHPVNLYAATNTLLF